ncbi:MAG: glycosyltransferase family 4 protein [Bdellovibrionales bacterium]|nr:glycosyltransferase family 4 protein [Bdellovibrionales bacterium]
MNLLWICPEEKGGIRTYSDGLWPYIQKEAVSRGHHAVALNETPTVQAVSAARPDWIHIQHEFGLFGSKIPWFYRFPKTIQTIRQAAPQARICVTAHSVLSPDYRYPVFGRGWLQRILRKLVNLFLIPSWVKLWTKGTWGIVDGALVHSESQIQILDRSGCLRTAVIPHYCYEPRKVFGTKKVPGESPILLLFGYFTPEKGQELLLQALERIITPVHVVFAGGVRRKEDQAYFDRCQALMEKLRARHRITVTGFVPEAEIDDWFAKASLVIAPFLETSGSGSITQAFSRGAAVVASDLPLNLDLLNRQKGLFAPFKTGDAESLETVIRRLLSDPNEIQSLSLAALAYAAQTTPAETAKRHFDFYQRILS